MQQLQQQPLLVAVLAGQHAGGSPAGAGAGAWLQLSPDTMHQHRLASQQPVLVALCSTPAQQAAAATLTASGRRPGSGAGNSSSLSPALGAGPQALASPSRFGPAAALALSPEDAQPADLWSRAGFKTSSDHQQQQQQQQLPGRFLLPVTLWPCARLARGSALLSAAAASSLALPADGDFVAVYPLPTGVTAVPAEQLQLQLCTDSTHGLPLTPSHIDPNTFGSSKSSSSGSADGSFATTPSRSPGPGGTSGFTTPSKPPGSSSKSRPKSSSKSGQKAQQQQQQAGAAPGAAGSRDTIAQWQLRLMHGGVDWSKAQHRQLLQQLAHKQLMGQSFLPGNITYLPVLGLQLLFRLTPAAAAPQQEQQQQPQQPLLITASTRLQLVMPGEDSPAAATGRNLASSSSQAAAAAMAASAGLSAGSEQQQGHRGLSSCVVAARAAAEQAVGGSSQEAAMAAAERAVRSGAAAAAGAAGLSRLGGISSYRAALQELIMLPLQLPELFAKYKLRPPKGLLLHGPPGSGKTVLARAAAVEAGATLLVVNGPDVISEFYGESEAGLSGIFAAAAALAPAVIFIDELDAIAPSREAQGHGGSSSHTAAAGGGSGSSAAGEAAARVLTQLLTLMDGLGSSGGSSSSSSSSSSVGNRVVVIGATNRPSALDSALRRPGRFERELEVGVPDPAAREDILRVRLASVKHGLTDEQLRQLAATTHGFVGADLAALVNEAALVALRRYVHKQQQQQRSTATAVGPPDQQDEQQQQQLRVSWDDVITARLLVKPSALREVAVEVPQVSWDDVGGLEGIKQRLQEAVLWPQQHAEALTRLGATAPKGVLLFGPPGCSKTLLARAVAASAGLNFLSVKGGELYSSFVGESERAIAALFARARAAAPAIVFFDELDGLVSNRGDAGAGAGIGERVLAQLLTELDGLQARLGVVVLAATNRPDKVDPALLRPGRFDRLLLVPPPDAAGRQEILRVHTRQMPLAPDVDLGSLAERTPGYTGADLSALCREAALAALQESLQAAAVAARHFDLALLRVRASSRPDGAVAAMYQQFQRHAGGSSVGGSSGGEQG